MRDLILLAGLACTIPLIARSPVLGLLAWIWIALMNPQREVYGFLRGFELNVYVAAFTALAWIVSRDRRATSVDPLTVCLVLFVLWGGVCDHFAIDRDHSAPIWNRTLKTVILAVAVTVLADTRPRLQAVVWMMVVSLGYYAVKGGGFVLATAGRHRVYGPESSMIADNNALGLALIVLLPLVNHLRATSEDRLVRWGCLLLMVADVLAVLGTYSRGALLAMGAAAATYAVKSRYGVLLVLAGAVLAVSLPSLLPANWFQRMSTIQSYDQDASFEGRVAAWKTSLAIAQARPLVGGGYAAVEVDRVDQLFHSEGSLDKGRAAHSIYFEVLGDTGFVGLTLYAAILACAWANTMGVLRAGRGRPDLHWACVLARMLQVSLTTLMVGGAALSMAYYDGFILMFAITAALRGVVRASPAVEDLVPAPRWKTLGRRRLAPVHP